MKSLFGIFIKDTLHPVHMRQPVVAAGTNIATLWVQLTLKSTVATHVLDVFTSLFTPSTGMSARSKKGRFRKKSCMVQYQIVIAANKIRKATCELPVHDQKAKTDTASHALSLETETSFPVTSRRIVDVQRLAHTLQRGCLICESPLQFINIETEVRRGLGCIWYVRCPCGDMTLVKTGPQHTSDSQAKKIPIFDINTKCATGKIFVN